MMGSYKFSGGSDRVLVLGGSSLCKARISLCITDAKSSMNGILYNERISVMRHDLIHVMP